MASPGGSLLLLFYGQQGSGPPPPASYATLLEAVIGTLQTALVPGTVSGVYWRLAPPQATLPFLVLNALEVPETWASVDSNSKRPTYDQWSFDVSCYHSGSKLASALGDTVATTLNDASLAFTNGTLLQISQSSFLPSELDPDRSPTTSPLWRNWRSFDAVVERLV